MPEAVTHPHVSGIRLLLVHVLAHLLGGKRLRTIHRKIHDSTRRRAAKEILRCVDRPQTDYEQRFDGVPRDALPHLPTRGTDAGRRRGWHRGGQRMYHLLLLGETPMA
jgi:hypothetical protein